MTGGVELSRGWRHNSILPSLLILLHLLVHLVEVLELVVAYTLRLAKLLFCFT